jgi:L-alanine-DL-glutamate epimerase-like enolase superfamily enzyme
LRITAVDIIPVAVPYKPEAGTVVTAGLQLTEARHLLIEVKTDAGVVGLGEAVPRPSVYGETVESIVAALRALLVPPILGMDPLDTERIWAKWDRVVANTSAKASLDMALGDIAGQVAGLPLYKLLGGWTDGRIRLTMPIAITGKAGAIEQAQAAVERGHQWLKMKVGLDLRRDIEVVAAVRDAVGPAVGIYIDANQGYSTADALAAAEEFARLRIALFEEPVAMGNFMGLAKLARDGRMMLLLDEGILTPADVARALALGPSIAFSIRSPKTGFSWSRKIVGLIETANLTCLVGSHRELGVGTVASAHLGAAFRVMAYPAELGVHVLLEDGLLDEPLRFEGGEMILPRGPGLGVTINRKSVERYRAGGTIHVS